jgi:anhydro-N-acetylmuramic acid kinase
MKIIGVMNGTSLDGVDIVGCQIQKPNKMKLLFHKSVAFPQELKLLLVQAAKRELKVDQLAEAHHELGRFYAKILKPLCRGYEVIGIHGQTVYHAAPLATLQIGEMAYVRASTGLPVVSNFRTGDLAQGGQGAPIASLFHKEVLAPAALGWLKKHSVSKLPSGFAKPNPKAVSIHNLGGISNLTWIHGNKVLAFDTGPANMLVDLFVQTLPHSQNQFDQNGILASKGTPNPHVLDQLLDNDYFEKKPPKSCGREEFGEIFLKRALSLLSGETGELCNKIKKVRRGENIPKEDLEEELGDIVIYADLLAKKLDTSLEKCVKQKFNAKSKLWNCHIKLGE